MELTLSTQLDSSVLLFFYGFCCWQGLRTPLRHHYRYWMFTRQLLSKSDGGTLQGRSVACLHVACSALCFCSKSGFVAVHTQRPLGITCLHFCWSNFTHRQRVHSPRCFQSFSQVVLAHWLHINFESKPSTHTSTVNQGQQNPSAHRNADLSYLDHTFRQPDSTTKRFFAHLCEPAASCTWAGSRFHF